ncbi:MAG: type VI secretion system needle protein Hcp [Tannerellaceae bacterium]|nr:type VI secretion system needle protein Hcp [Tannerellaceae bacterium]
MASHKTFLKLGDVTDLFDLAKTGYELANFEFSFQQGIDDTGNASTRVSGGALSLILPTFPTNELIDWAVNSWRFKNGMIVVMDPLDNPLEKIRFRNAACINMNMTYTSRGKAYATTSFIIQAEELYFGSNVDFKNNWVKSK